MPQRSCMGPWRGVLAAALVLILAGGPLALAEQSWPHPGTKVFATALSFDDLWAKLEAAIGAHHMGIVGRASASRGAAARGVSIPGNAVIGVYRNDFAVRMLEASVAAGIEAPLRFYLYQTEDGATTLVYRSPSAVFAPYGSAKLDAMARELDAIFAAIAGDATGATGD